MTITEALTLLLGGAPVSCELDEEEIELCFWSREGGFMTINDTDRNRLKRLEQLYRHEKHRATTSPAAGERPTISIVDSVVHGDVVAGEKP